MVVFNLDDGDVEDMSDVAVKEYLETLKKCLSE